jgi:hypothetical protein
MGPTVFRETFVRNYHSTLRKFWKRAQVSEPEILLPFSQKPFTVISVNTHDTILRFFAFFPSNLVSGILAKLRKATVNLAISVRMDQLRFH